MKDSILQYRKYIYEIYKSGSFMKAAENLFISQPALSFTIKKFEEELGTKIFDRHTKPTTLTPAGELYIHFIEDIARLEKNFFVELSDLQDAKTGHITIGCASYVMSNILPDILQPFRLRHPRISLELVEMPSFDLNLKLSEDALDIVVDSSSFNQNHFQSDFLLQETILLAVPCGFDINRHLGTCGFTPCEFKENPSVIRQKKELDITLFSGESFILLKPGNEMRVHSNQIFTEAGIEPSTILELDQLVTSYNYALKGFGACFVTDRLIEDCAPNNLLLLYRIKSKWCRRSIYATYKKNRYIPRAVKAFLKDAASVCS